MKQFIIYSASVILSVTLLALSCDRVNLWLIRHSSGNSAAKMERLWQRTHKDEIPILGSSRAVGNFVPSVIATNCFNYGVNGMGLNEVLFNLSAIRERKSQYPIILNFDPWGNVSNDTTSWVGDYRLAPRSKRMGILDVLPGIRFHGMLRSNITSFLNEKKGITKVIDQGAVLIKTSRSSKEWEVINAKITSNHFGITEEGVEKIQNVLTSLAPRRVIVVVCPCSSQWMKLYKGRKQLVDFLTRIEGLPNVDTVNMYGSELFSDTDFVDPTHLNIEGAKKFTKILVNEITQK